jgi:hypothetical protein
LKANPRSWVKTLEQHFAELGQDFEEEMRVRAQNAKRILELAEEYGVPVEMLWASTGNAEKALWGIPKPP